MKKLCIVVVTLGLVGFMVPAVFAKGGKGKGAKNPASQTVTSDAYAKYDTNNDAVLSAAEIAAIRKDYAANKEDALLKVYDVDADGKLSDNEISAIPITKTIAPDAPAKKKKGKKKQ